MVKKVTLSALVLASSLFAGAEVNVYSSRHYDTDKELYTMFEKKTGIHVNIIKAKADALIKRMQSEGKKSPADVLITVDAARIFKAQELGLFQSIKSDFLEKNIPAQFRDKDNRWFAVTKRARIVAIKKDSKLPDPVFYEDLADPKYKGQIMVRSSSNVYNQSLMAAYIAHNGVEKATEWAKGVVANMARNPKGSDRDQARGVASGIGSIAIMNTYYVGKLANGKDADKDVVKNIKVFFPKFKNGGTHVNVSAAGVAKFAKNKDNAVKFIEFLASKEAQAVFAKGNYEYPILKDAEISPLVKSWGTFKQDDISINKLGEENAAAVKALDVAGWK